jgi:hypothetical protein
MRTNDMIYIVDLDKLFSLSTVIRLLGGIREIPDAITRSEVLTEAQILLTAFVLELKPLPRNETDPITLAARPDEMTGFDA